MPFSAFSFNSRPPGLEVSFALRMPAVAVDLSGIASPFTVGAAILFALLNFTIAGCVLTGSSLFLLSHLSLSSS
jgi:hypothetical protein